MLSYQHGYHAGSFADVIKHSVLVHILAYLTQKEKPIFYLETHAGRGIYPLKNQQAQKTKEYQSGILPLWNKTLPKSFEHYISIIKNLNPTQTLNTYPGSPCFARDLLRPEDRLTFCEQHPQEYDALTKLPKQGKRINTLNQDGYLALNALLPPLEKRGLIFIDPSFEIKTEYQTLPKHLTNAYQRFPQGVYCVWYPITPAHDHERMIHKLKAQDVPKTLHLQYTFAPTEPGLCGMGLWIINPPYTLSETLPSVLEYLREMLPHQNVKITVISS